VGRTTALAAAAFTVLLAPAPAASAPGLPALVERHLAAVEHAAAAAGGRDPVAVQARYDAARDLQVALAGRDTPGCPVLYRQLARFAAANVRGAEAFDRLRPGAIAGFDRAAAAALADVRRSRRPCTDGRLVTVPAPRADDPAIRRADAVLADAASPRPARPDRRLATRLRAALRGFDGEAAVWVHDLETGRAAGIGADDRYPAASTVKLGVLVAALARYGNTPRVAPDLEAMTSWSSNLAANRLWRLVGGDTAVESTLRRLGAAVSTYPGPYRAGTIRSAPPLVSRRVTTARDLGRVLARLHGAALGRPRDLDATGLTQREARIALGLLMRADDSEGALVPPVPAARKHGWVDAARLTAALLFPPRGAVIVVLLAYRDGIPTQAVQQLGRRVAAAALA
jgi:beta-lactamase class A